MFYNVFNFYYYNFNYKKLFMNELNYNKNYKRYK